MSESISFTVPLSYRELHAVAKMLREIADDLQTTALGPGVIEEAADTTAHVTTRAEEAAPGPDDIDLEVAGQGMDQDLTADGPGLSEEELKNIAASVPPPAVDLAPGTDGEPIPWDHRIHSATKSKYAKPPGGWKLKRGVSGALVEQVEAELRAVLAASPSNPVETTTAADAFTEEVAPGPDDVEVTTPPAINTFAELNVAITNAGIDPTVVNAAVVKLGLAVYPQLINRLDLIPGMVAELFPS